MSKPVKIAIVGAGYGSKVALPAYAELDEFKPVAMWSRRPERARELAEGGEVELGTSDFEELLPLSGLEAVHIATPVATHAQFAIASAQRGLHIMCEKPLADSLPAASGIVSAIRSAGVVGAVNYGRRMQESRGRVLERAREVLGTPRMASVQCDGPLEASSSDAFKRVARSFASAIREGTPAEPSLEEGLRVQALFDAVRAADVQRGWVVPEAVPSST